MGVLYPKHDRKMAGNQNRNCRILNMDADQIIGILKDDAIRTVSFNLVDTLLTIPELCPGDIFSILRDDTHAKTGGDHQKIHYAAEEELFEEHEELLLLRQDVKKIYDDAAASGKRIIVTWRQQFRESAVKGVLCRKGFVDVGKVYTSSDPAEAESTDSFYDSVLTQEGIRAAELLHIDSDYDAGYKLPLKKGITAVYYPGIRDIALHSGAPWGKLLQGAQDDPVMGVHFSFALLYAWNANVKFLEGRRFFCDLEGFAVLFFGSSGITVGVNHPLAQCLC